jgi:hypothetical protein
MRDQLTALKRTTQTDITQIYKSKAILVPGHEGP